MELLIPILLIAVGLGLIVAEVYLIPGFNVVGIAGVLMMIFAIGFAFSEVGMVGGVGSMLLSIGGGTAVFYGLWKSGAWDRFVLSTNLKRDDALIARESEQRARFLGKPGVAITPLRPTGVVEISGNRIEALTEGEFIAEGSRIKVVAMDRRRYFVRLAEGDVDPPQA